MSKVVGGCSKHPGQGFLNCPICQMETFISENKITSDEEEDLAYMLVILKCRREGIKAEQLIKIVENFDKLKSIFK